MVEYLKCINCESEDIKLDSKLYTDVYSPSCRKCGVVQFMIRKKWHK